MLVTVYLMVGQKALFTAIRLYGAQSLLLGIVAATMAIADARPHLFVMAGLTVVLNAVFLIALGITSGMPLVVELGISFDVILAVLVLGILVGRIVDRFESMDVSRLSRLKG